MPGAGAGGFAGCGRTLQCRALFDGSAVVFAASADETTETQHGAHAEHPRDIVHVRQCQVQRRFAQTETQDEMNVVIEQADSGQLVVVLGGSPSQGLPHIRKPVCVNDSFGESKDDVQVAAESGMTAVSNAAEIDFRVDQLQVLFVGADRQLVGRMVLQLSGNIVLDFLTLRRSDAVEVVIALKWLRSLVANKPLQPSLHTPSDFGRNDVWLRADEELTDVIRQQLVIQNPQTCRFTLLLQNGKPVRVGRCPDAPEETQSPVELVRNGDIVRRVNQLQF